jgi:hypothetical protein
VSEKREITIENREALFGQGPWLAEPDRVEWRQDGFVCLMVRQPRRGHWCGYVGVEPGHVWHGAEWDRVDADVHGGVTYAEHCAGNVCHVPEPGEPEHLYWIGFDCAHAWDVSPSNVRLGGIFAPSGDEAYRDEPYVRAEVMRLVEQAKQPQLREVERYGEDL